MLDRNSELINQVIQIYEPDKSLTVLKGMRKTLPADAFPSLEIEPTSTTNQWWTTRSQRPRYEFNCTLTVLNDNEDYGVEYPMTIASKLSEIITDPTNLQLPVENESKWDENGGLLQTYILDSLIESMTLNANKDGTIRTVEFGWFAMIHEPFPESKWEIGNMDLPTIVRPMKVE
jgi:hypothetical protein